MSGSRATNRPHLTRERTISFATVGVFLALWQAAPALGWANAAWTSQPSRVAAAAYDVLRTDDFLGHLAVSAAEFALGFTLALGVALPLGALLGVSRRSRLLLDPLLMTFYIAPTLVLLPVLVIWLGVGMASKVAVVFLAALFPVALNTSAGVREVDPQFLRMAKAFSARRRDLFLRVLAPAALPAVLTGIRLGVGRGVIGVVVGELFASQAGLGYQLVTYGAAMRIDRLLVYALAIGLLGFAATSAVRGLETRVRRARAQA